MPTTTGYEFGDVVLVPFPFTDQRTTKRRPAVVVRSERYHQERPDLIILAVTSQVLAEPALSRTGWSGPPLVRPSWST
jgi:mRNA interferase MazF